MSSFDVSMSANDDMPLPPGHRLVGEKEVEGARVYQVERESDGQRFWTAGLHVRLFLDGLGRLTKTCGECDGQGQIGEITVENCESCWRCGGLGRVLEDGSRAEPVERDGDPLPRDPSS